MSTVVLDDRIDQVNEIRHMLRPIDDFVQFHCVFVEIDMQAGSVLEVMT